MARNLWLVLAIGALAACQPIYRSHGYVPSDSDLAMLVVGQDTRDTVGDFIGRPSSAGVLEDGGWYYVGSRWRELGLRKPQEISREVVAISFNEGGVVQNIERFGLEDGRVVTLSRRVTDSNIKGVTFLGQLLGSIGNVNAGQFLN
ncbi:outer membrane protein assembly factor BamE [Frigidibacter albus]|uniref:Outer membrane protein assembly factor BamE n=2 Tax=Frigidibacter albus TaxID=1465486 RepID=A0A6L8VJJ0_9RHOB|nr:outer membrane protein assembly factor BamE [Frigidibacter albus]NBE31769.1 outer membrane protein assembly factor BamE [Frigidibacter albus]GGH56302.1 outer membrane protein assembly factor BamE [Frigidibacter albus]